MRDLRGTNVTIFLLFFGLTLLEALETRNWLRAVFWLAMGLVFSQGRRVSPRALRERSRDAGIVRQAD
jgi:hypothetical protein